MARLKLLRKLSHVSAALLAVHVALIALFFIVGSFMGIMAPAAFANIAKTIIFSGVVNLAVFCLSTQFYLAIKRRVD